MADGSSLNRAPGKKVLFEQSLEIEQLEKQRPIPRARTRAPQERETLILRSPDIIADRFDSPDIDMAINGQENAIIRATKKEVRQLEIRIATLSKKLAREHGRETATIETVAQRIGTLENDFRAGIGALILEFKNHPFEENSKVDLKYYRVLLEALLATNELIEPAFDEKGFYEKMKEPIRKSRMLKAVRFGVIEAEQFRAGAFAGVTPPNHEKGALSNAPTDAQMGESARVSLENLRWRINELLTVDTTAEQGARALDRMKRQRDLIREALFAIEKFERELPQAENIPDYAQMVHDLPEQAAKRLKKGFAKQFFNRLTNWKEVGDELVETPNPKRFLTEEERDAFFHEAEQMRERLARLVGAYDRVIDTVSTKPV